MPSKFGATVRKLRRAKDATQKQMGDAVNLSPGFISQIECGGQLPTPAATVRIARYLGLDPLRMLKLARPEDAKVWQSVMNRGNE